MTQSIIVAFLNNAALLLALSVAYDVTYLVPDRYRRMQPVLNGLLITLICGIVMSVPITIQSGLIFDTRSILLSVTALIFGPITTVIAVVLVSLYRLSIGGIGLLSGLATILSSALIGLAWRHWVFTKTTKNHWLSIFAMSVIVHITMLACQLLLLSSEGPTVIRDIAVPVMLIYPVASVLLSLLLLRKQTLKRTEEQLRQSEEKFKQLFEKAPLGYQSLDIDGRFVEVNQQWLDTFGYARDEVIGKYFDDFLSAANREAFLSKFPVLKSQGFIHCELDMLHKTGKPLFISFEGRAGYDFNGKFIQTHCILQDITNQKAAEDALAESEKKYRSIAENMSDVVWLTDLNLTTTYVSPSVEKLTGDPPEVHLKRTLEERFSVQTRNKILALANKALRNEQQDPQINKNRKQMIEVEHFKADGTAVWVEMSISIIRDAQDKAIGFLGVSRDVSARRRSQMALKESERSKTMLLANLPGMAYRCNNDHERTMQFISAGCFELTGYTPEGFINNKIQSFNDIILPKYRDSVSIQWAQALSKKQPFQYEYEIMTAGGEPKSVLDLGQGVYDENGKVEALEGIIIDISQRKRLENKLKYNTEHDLWTGLYNLRYLGDILSRDVQMPLPGKRAVVGIDFSAVQLLIMTYGFHYSQELIKKMADILKLICNDDRQLFHTYEKLFAFYVKNYRDKDELMAFCEEVFQTLKSVLTPERIGINFGIVEITEDTEQDVEHIIKKLMVATENASDASSGGYGLGFYDTQMETRIMREQGIEDELAQIALGENTQRLYLNFQAILDLKSNKICGFEALVRLNSDSYGQVLPTEFIPIAERTKLINPLGQQIILQAFHFLNTLKENGYESIYVSINISVIQLLQDGFVKELVGLIEEKHINPQDIVIEITESVFASNNEPINKVLDKLMALGIKTAIDDFGTKYSSLSRERELHVNCIKIDKSFIDGLLQYKEDESITGDIIAMAHKLGHSVIAEGVEQERQRQYLKHYGCDMIQGYLISKPIDVAAVLELLNN